MKILFLLINLTMIILLFNIFFFIFWKCFFSDVSQESERCFVNFFDCSTYYFWCNLFNFCFACSYCLVNSLLGNFVNVWSSLGFDTWSNFSCLIYNVSASLCEVISIQESSGLRSPFSSSSIFSSFCTILWVDSYLEVSVF